MAGSAINLVDYNTTTAFWTFLIYCLVVIFVAVFFLFYASRVFAQLLSKLIRWFTWRHLQAYIEFESLQIAPLGGRILFKNFRYHSRNQSITVLHGFVSFRYWLWNVRTEDDPIPEDSTGSKEAGAGTTDEDNCRITCHLVGLEWFMYNRTPAYDVLATTLGLNPDGMPLDTTPDAANPSVSVNMDTEKQDDEPADSWFRRCLPVKIVCETGAIIMGNAHLPSLLVASFPSAHGMYSATKTRSSLDKYKTVLLVTFETPSIDFKPNADYNTGIAGRHMGTDIPDITRLPPSGPSRLQQIIRPLKATWTSYFGVSREVAEEWHGLPRYNQNVSYENLKENSFSEYAMVRNVLQCNELGLRYYTDIAGTVPESSQNSPHAEYDLPPEWGMELIIDEAVISYGPWADRQRSEIQNFYFPNAYRTLSPMVEAMPGQDRIHAALQIMVTFSSSVTIKIPTQEKSKDWKYTDPEFQAVQGGKSMRPYGWLELKAAHGSMISVDIPMVYGADGYKNVVLVDLQNLVVTSSVNYAPVINLKELKMVCQLQNPLVWNAQRDWDFEITLDTPKIFILRDHITLIQDLSKDWTSGPPIDMAHFVPFKYEFDIKLPNFQLYTYVNEHNIINEPTEIDENAFIIAAGQALDCKVVLPFVQYSPEITTITFDVEIRNGGLEIQLPLAHTLGEFSTADSKKFATIPSVAIKGTYEYYDFVDPSHLESLNLDVKGHGVTIKMFGNVVRYILILMDNYAGLYLNFVTMEEYRKKRIDAVGTEKAEQKQADAKPPSDAFEVYVHFLITDTTLMLPENLYSSENFSQITCAELQLDLRNLDVYMDMHVNVSPLTWSRDIRDAGSPEVKPSAGDHNYLFVDGISIYAHRLFGPLPKTTTYVANWTLDIGSIYGQIKPSFLLGVSSFAKSFVYNLKDGDNAFPPEYATVIPPDITFVDLSVKEVDISIWGEDVVSQILLKDGIIVQFDDVINERYMGRVVVKMQSLLVRSMALTDASKDDHKGEPDPSHQDHAPWVEIASLNCAFDVTVYQGAGDWRERREKQQAFVREQDRETLRCPYIYSRKGQESRKVLPHPNLKGNHFGTIYVPPLTSDPAAMKGDTIGSSDSIVEVPSEDGSMFEYASNASSASSGPRLSVRRSTSSFSIGASAESDSGSESESHGSNDRDWPDIDSDDLELRYSSEEGDSESEYDYTEILQVGPEADEIKNSSTVPARSIPYSSYLKRYTVSSTRAAYHRQPYLPPPRVRFTQSQSGEILEDVPRHHPRANFDEAFGIKGDYHGSISSAQPKGNEKSDEKRTTIIVEATQDVKILLTPILLKIIQEFLEAINAEEWDLETMLDVTQMEYVELLTRMQPSKMHSQQFMVNVPRVHLRFIQDVMMPDALNGADDINMIKTRYELSGANLCAIDIVLDDAAIIAAVKYEDEEFEKFEPGKIHIASFKVVESRANVDFSRFKLNARFVSASTARIFGIPDARHQFSHLGINHLSYLKEPVIADISFERFQLRLIRTANPNYFSANLEKLSVLFINQSAEIVAGSICSWLTFVKDLKTILNRFQLRRSKQLQTLFSEIARFSAQKAINTDPVFLTRPSTTLRLGTMIYRNDDGWKLLAHIRHCMRLMPPTLSNTLQEALKKPELESFSTDTMYDIVIAVFSKWRSWEMDDLRHCRLFSDVFERKRVLDADSAATMKESWMYELLRYSANSIQLSLGELEAAIYDEQQENRTRITGLELIFESRYKADVLAQAGLFPGVPISDETNRLNTGFLDIAVKTGFKSAEVDLNPVIIAFTRHILRIERIFTPQVNKILESAIDKRPLDVRRSFENPSSPRQSIHLPRETTAVSNADDGPTILQVINRFDVVFNGMAVVETIRITLTAHNLSAQIIFSQIQLSALNFAKQRTFPNQDIEGISVAKSSGSNPDGSPIVRSGYNKLIASIATNISSINSSLKERVYSKDHAGPMPTKELLQFGIVGINSEATLSQFTPAKRPKQTKASVPREVINLLVTFKQVNIALPRSILKLYLFAKDWREENMQSFDFLFQGVMNELEADRKRQPKTVTPSTLRELKVQIVLKTLTLESHMLPSLLFQYEAGDLMVMFHDVPPGLQYSVPRLTYTAQLLRQSVDFIANQPKTRGGDRLRLQEDKHAASFSLPVIRASGSVMNVVDSATPVRTRRASISALARGARHPKKLESSMSFDFVEMTLNVNMLDHILTAQSLLGAEANELIDILSKGSKTGPGPTSPAITPTPSDSTLLYSVNVSLVGLSIAAVSPSAVLYFESDLLKGFITNNPNPAPASVISPTSEIVKNKLAWQLYAQSITLSLNHHVGNIRMGSRAEDIRARKLRLAYITIRLNVQNFRPKVSNQDHVVQTSVNSFYVSFLKVHALMQPQSVSRIIGLYSYYTHELERRKELKASDMAKLADNTKRIIKTLEVEVPTYKDNTRSILEATEITLSIDDVAVAIPLDRREDIMDSSERLVEAFMVSATSITILTKSGETSEGELNQLCAQFVPRFDQSKDEHFRSRSHPKMNRLLFPGIACQVEATKDSPGHQKVSSKATVSGFELDIDPNIVRYINTLSDVYDNSKGLVTSLAVEQAASAVPTTKSEGALSTNTPNIVKGEVPTPQTSSNVIWKIENTFQCKTSVCRFYPKSYVSKLPKASKFMDSEPNVAHVGAEVSGVDRFIIPGLSLWTSLRIPLGDNLLELEAAGPPRVHAEVNIHSCENTFYPSLVPFFQDVVSGLKVGIRQQRQYSKPEMVVPIVSSTAHVSGNSGDELALVAPSSSGQDSNALQQMMGKRQELVVTCYLFIEKTRIEFNCQPMAKVMSVLTLEQGNILMSYNSDRAGNSSTTIAGTFEGASSDTHHIFSQDKGFRLITKGMIFNAVAETKRQAVVNKKALSVTVDFRQIAVDFDLRQAEILVLMKMIWMDQANYLIRDGLTASRSTSGSQGFEASSLSQPSPGGFAGPSTSTGAAEPATGAVLVSEKRESSFLGYNVFVVARLQQMKITGDLGSQIGKMDFKLDEVRLRTKLRPFHPRSASISIGPLDLQFLPMDRGWLEGYVIMEGITLETLSKVNRHPTFPCSIVEIVLQTKRMTSILSYDYKKFFILAVEPARLVLQDDWKSPNMERDVSQVIIAHLDGLRLLAGAKTVPVFKNLVSRLTSTMEQKVSAAEQELKKPLPSASTLQPSASADIHPSISEPNLADLQGHVHPAWNTVGRVQISIGDLNLSFFPYFLSDKECTHASIQGVKTRLERDLSYPENDKPVIHRRTTIELGLLSLQKYILQVIDQSATNSFTLEQWFDRIRNPSSTTIAKVPRTTQIMESWQALDSHVIEHICKTDFGGLIDITTDYRLFRGVEKNFQRFLEELSIRNFIDMKNLADDAVVPTVGATTGDTPVGAANVMAGVDVVTEQLRGTQPLSRVNSHDPTLAIANGLGQASVSNSLDVIIPGASSGISKSEATSAVSGTTTVLEGAVYGEPLLTLSPSSPILNEVPVTTVSSKSSTPSAQTNIKIDGGAGGPAVIQPSVSSAGSGSGSGGGLETGNGDDAAGTSADRDFTGASQATTLNQSGQPAEASKGAQLTFQAREQIVFKPALDVLPNTPLPLGHLGFKKEDIPPIIHVATMALETGLLTVAEIHAKKVEMSGLRDLWEGKIIMDDEEIEK
ncbi:hypothetical protein BC939DRAFT_40483 [Gamsiella multidivaricata]|uniref:uncharacterized protein n=1 Tax=Gamsiella multidivaricata TaxID=101098 RepID=UPI002220787B|nr:uncharacterized protein BC939DRAFT_40483 [Gamsiella multidivaricata]KAI7829028.1 hypothetical protein BC939DRAFT_40483 [Gamsiella multidivaricata]